MAPAPIRVFEEHRSRSRRSRIVVVIVLLVALAGITAIGVGLVTKKGTDPLDHLADPDSVQLPDLPDDPATVTFLRGDGAQLVAAVRLAGMVPGDEDRPSVDGCRSLASDLDGVAPPATLFELSSRIDDVATRDMFDSTLSAAILYLDGCIAGDENTDASDLRFTTTVVRRQLEELGV